MTASRMPPGPSRGLSGRQVLAGILVFFGLIVVADATLIYKAVSTFGGVDNANAYRDGLAYNERIAREAKQAQLGWSETVELLANPARLRISLKDAGGTVPPGLRVEATLGRPATNVSDIALRLAEVGPGVFEAPLETAPGTGAWIVTARAYAADEAASDPLYQVRRRLWVAP
ncbi:FixH family protein [Hyphomicrobium sp.]|uniref:FixH family protein n=1 Tax=Hyphomicrobium sp. TaxID=82 RepID=UPI002FE2A5C1